MRLRPPEARDAHLLELWRSPQYLSQFNDFGVPPRKVADVLHGTGFTDGRGGTMIVEVIAGGEPIGTVSWHEVRYGPNPESVALNIGIELIPKARGKGFGVEAQRLLAQHLLDTTRVNRIEASTDVDNLAEQRALEKAGFSRDGLLRGAQFRAGAWHDLLVYSMVRPPAELP
ncbi:MAG TPA: GNAT family protein [Patescibacteria group bacterium]|nr:GNAT family protein [Patescibacteria group bacterium]